MNIAILPRRLGARRRLTLVSSTLLAALVAACGAAPGEDSEAVSRAGSAVSAAAPVARVMPTVSGAKVAASATPDGASGVVDLSYNGGSVIANVTAIPVFWGSSVDATTRAGIGDYLYTMVSSPYVGWLSEYNTPTQNIGPGSAAAPSTIFPHNTATTLSPSDISNELNAQISAGNLTAPSANSLYIVYLPPGDTATLGGSLSCASFCGYHTSAPSTAGGFGSVRFAVIPDMTAPTCDCHGDPDIFKDVTEVTSHEIVEAITDPDPFSGWNSGSGEIGDLCVWQPATLLASGASYNVQREWSNAAAGCIVGHFASPAAWLDGAFFGDKATLEGDVTGDGKADLIAVNAGSTYVAASNGTGFAAPVAWSSGAFFGDKTTLAADVDGDGKVDLVAVNGSSVWVVRSTGSSFGAPTQYFAGAFSGDKVTLAGDVTGDSLADLIAVDASSSWILPSKGSSFGPPVEWQTVPFFGSKATLAADVDGDRLVDLVALNSGNVYVQRSTGSSFGPPTVWNTTPFFGDKSTLLGDLNGDGASDLIASDNQSTWIMLSTRTGFGPPTKWQSGAFYGGVATLAGDVDGDGLVDLAAVNSTNTWVMRSP